MSNAVMSNEVIYQFPYRMNPVVVALVIPLVFSGAALCLYFAIYPGEKNIDFKGIPITPTQFRYLMGTIALTSPFTLFLMAKALMASLRGPLNIALTEQSIFVPKPDWWGICSGPSLIELRYDDIVSAEVVPFVGRTKQLKITFLGGMVGIPSNMLPTRRDFDLLTQLLTNVIR
jgi:hypothetical protein